MKKIRRNDTVMVMSGEEKGKTGKVLRFEGERVFVEGRNLVWRHLRRSQQHPHGARIQKEASIHVSNLALLCPSCSKPAKVGVKTLEQGGRVRVCKKCKQPIVAGA